MSFFALWWGVMFPLVFSPGPANIVFASSGAKFGVKRSLPLLAGIDTVFILQSLIIGLGFGAFLQTYPLIIEWFQVLGALYILYLAWGFAKAENQPLHGEAKSFSFKDGAIIELFNAKGWLLVFLMFASFSEPAQQLFGNASTLVLVVMLAVLNISMHLVWIAGGDFIGRLMKNEKHQKIQKIQNYIYALSLMIVGFWLLIDNPLWKKLLA